jgi:hypothetical protein
MPPIVEYLRVRLRAMPPATRAAVALEAGVAPSLVRKLASGDRENPRVGTIQPLLDFLVAVDRGERELPRGEEVEKVK